MAGRPRPRREGSSALIASVLTLGLFAGAAIANPGAFDRSLHKAVSLFQPADQGQPDDRRQGRAGNGPETHGPQRHTPEDCAAIVAEFDVPTQDVKGLAHAIEMVRANCEKNPKAKGLLNALRRLLVNAGKHAAHESNARGNGKGHGPHPNGQANNGQANGHANGNGNGNAGHNGRGNGHGN
jgi:hypothetical protein